MSIRAYAQERIQKLDLSGGPKSWSDLWHIRLPLEAVEDPYRATTREDVLALMQVHEELARAVAALPQAYQLFILIDEHSYRDNAVYFHTANPNGTPFPLSIPSTGALAAAAAELCSPLTERNWRVVVHHIDGVAYYHAYDPAIGLPLTR